MIIDTCNLANMALAAACLEIRVEVLEKLMETGTGPDAIIYKGDVRFDLDDVYRFKKTKTIRADGTVVDKIKSTMLGYRQHEGRSRPILACYCTGDDEGDRTLTLIVPSGERKDFASEGGFGSADGTYKPEGGFFLREVTNPELAGLGEMFFGSNAIEPDFTPYEVDWQRSW